MPPPGVGLKTVTEAVPAEAMSVAGTIAVNCVALPKVVVNAAPFHFTTEALMKFVPVTVRVNAAPPAVAEVGEIIVSVGEGLFVAALMVNVCALEVPPPGVGFKTVTEAVPAEAMSVAGTIAVSCVALPKVVVNAAPFQFTTEELMKFVPVTVRVNAAPPAVAEVGEIIVSVGEGLPPAEVIVNGSVVDPAVVSGTGATSVAGRPLTMMVVSRIKVTVAVPGV